jgi:photosystem II stability/assembly factor-like uncharacterized protein
MNRIVIHLVVILIALHFSSYAQWAQQESGTAFDLFSVYFIDANTGYVAGDHGTILKTTNGGSTWTDLSLSMINPLEFVHFSDVNNGLIATNNSFAILKTTNGGTTWSTQTISAYGIFSISFPDENTWYAVGRNGAILKTTDGGSSWSSLSSGTSLALNSVFFTNTDVGYTVGIPNGEILKTNDGGVTWNTLSSGTTVYLLSVFFTDANTGYAAGGLGTILKTTDAGGTWNILPSGTNETIKSIYFINSTRGYAVGTNGTILETTNAGVSWTLLDGGTSNTLNSVFFVNASIGYVTGNSGTILKITNSSGINEKENIQFELAPNPASEVVTLNVDNRIIENMVLRIYNIVGELIRSETLKQNQQNINVNDLKDGNYIFEIKSKDQCGRQNFIIQR